MEQGRTVTDRVLLRSSALRLYVHRASDASGSDGAVQDNDRSNDALEPPVTLEVASRLPPSADPITKRDKELWNLSLSCDADLVHASRAGAAQTFSPKFC